MAGSEVDGVFSEVTLRSGLGAVEATAEINAVQVGLHDFLFRKILLDAPREIHLHEFALVGALAEFEGISRELLGNGAGALRDAALDVVRERGPEDAHVVHAIVGVEAVVLGGNDRVHQSLRQAVVGNGLAVLDENLAELAALAVVEHRGGLHFRDLLEIEFLGAAFVLAREDAESNPCGKGSYC